MIHTYVQMGYMDGWMRGLDMGQSYMPDDTPVTTEHTSIQLHLYAHTYMYTHGQNT